MLSSDPFFRFSVTRSRIPGNADIMILFSHDFLMILTSLHIMKDILLFFQPAPGLYIIWYIKTRMLSLG